MIVNWNGLSGAGEQNELKKYYPPPKTNTRTKQLIQSKYTVLNIVCVPAVDEVVWKMTRDLFVMWTAMWIIYCMLIHQSKIQIWEDWKCYRTHTCKVYCTSRSSSDQVAKGFFDTRISHICCFSWIYLLLSQGKTQNNKYMHLAFCV